MNIKNELPPNWKLINKNFETNDKCYFTYGDTIYNPYDLPLPEEIIEHEKVHMQQHEHSRKGAKKWWKKYIEDPEFRIDQEARAYARQYDVYCKNKLDRNHRARYLVTLTHILSGPLYGNSIDFNEAKKLITKYSVCLG